jgi:NitT/TauT family transport system permease protein
MKKVWLLRLLFAIAILGFWQAASGRLISPLYVSTPLEIGERFFGMLADGSLIRHASITAFEAGAGFVLGGGAGIVMGIVLGRARLLADVLDPFVLAFYSLPKVALAPLFVMWFGIDIGMKIVFAGVVVFFLVFLSTYSGVRNVSRELITVFRLMGAQEGQLVSKVILPAALTWVFSGLRMSVPYALVGAIIAELIAANRGLGYLVANSTTQFDTAGALAAVLAILILSAGFNALIRIAETRLMPWRVAEESREVAV